MAFQWIIDTATEIKLDSHAVVAQTRARDGSVKAVRRGAQPWTFTVTSPDGPKFSEVRKYLAEINYSDRHSPNRINFNHTGHEYMFEYQGDRLANYGSVVANVQQGSDIIELTNVPSGSGNMVVAGDYIQLGPNGVYMAVETTVSNSFKVHRPVIENLTTSSINVGVGCNFLVRCVQFPQYRIFGYDQVAWDGPFVFVEEIL